MLQELIVPKYLSWLQVSYFIEALLLCVYHLPFFPLWVSILELHLYGCLYSDFTPLNDVESSRIRILIKDNIVRVESLLLKEIVKLENTVVRQLVQEL